jgi:hypothetical protein
MDIDSRYGQEVFLVSVASQPALGPAQPAVRLVFGVKRPDREAEPSLPSNVVVKNEAAYTSTPPHVFMACCLNKHGDNLPLALVNAM